MKTERRYQLICLILCTIVGGLACRIIGLHVFEKGFLRGQGDARTIRVVSTPAYRGMITDRNGEPLAISTPVNSVWVNPKDFDFEHPQLLALAATLDLSLEELLDKVQRKGGREFLYLQRHVSPEVAEHIKKLAINGIHLKSEYRRYYPAGEVVSHVVGFTNIDGKGQEGLELAYENWLQGRAGSKRVVRDRLGREIQTLEGLHEMQSGQNAILSLDQRLQYLAYRELKASVTECQAIAGTAIVLDVQTGEVLAMVNQPSFNPNLRIKIQDGRYRNRAALDKLEPGSVVKPFSVASALQNGLVTPSTEVDTSPGWMTVGGHVVREVKNKNYGVLDVAGILKKSSNVGVSKLTLSLPPECLWETYKRVGFGSATGSGFPGESAGTLHLPPKKGSFVLATMAFGYGMSVTPLQLAQAYATLGAGGVKRPVTFLKQLEISAGEQVMDPIVARQVVDMLTSVVEQGSNRAKVVGYQTAGKTGTARKLNAAGGYRDDSHYAVFAGLAPASNPRFAIVVVVDDPKGNLYYGGEIAAPLFSKIAAGALRLFNIPPDIQENQNLRIAIANEGEGVSLHE